MAQTDPPYTYKRGDLWARKIRGLKRGFEYQIVKISRVTPSGRAVIRNDYGHQQQYLRDGRRLGGDSDRGSDILVPLTPEIYQEFRGSWLARELYQQALDMPWRELSTENLEAAFDLFDRLWETAGIAPGSAAERAKAARRRRKDIPDASAAEGS